MWWPDQSPSWHGIVSVLPHSRRIEAIAIYHAPAFRRDSPSHWDRLAAWHGDHEFPSSRVAQDYIMHRGPDQLL